MTGFKRPFEIIKYLCFYFFIYLFFLVAREPKLLNEGRTILVTFLVSVTNYWRNAIKEAFILAHSLRVQSVMAGKTWQQQGEIAGHIAI